MIPILFQSIKNTSLSNITVNGHNIPPGYTQCIKCDDEFISNNLGDISSLYTQGLLKIYDVNGLEIIDENFWGSINYNIYMTKQSILGVVPYPIGGSDLRIGTLGFTGLNVSAYFSQSVSNSYFQHIIQNKASGQTSADMVVSNDLSTDDTYYGDLGINSSEFTGVGSMSLPNATYLVSSSGDLVIGSNTANNVRLLVNDSETDSIFIDGNNGNVSFNVPVILNSSLIDSQGYTGSKDQVLIKTSTGGQIWSEVSSVGSTGIQGVTGLNGACGTQGATGIQGVTGPASSMSCTMGIALDTGSSNVTTGIKKAYAKVPYNGVITGWTVLTSGSVGSISISILKCVYASFPPSSSNNICGSNYITLTSAIKNQSTTGWDTGWTTVLNAGDIIGIEILTSPLPSVTNVSVLIDILKS
jgi:hypothetical protein